MRFQFDQEIWIIMDFDYGFLSFAKDMSKNIGKNISKRLSGEYSQKLLIMLNNLLQMHLNLLQKVTGDLTENKIAGKVTKIPKTSQQNNSETITNEHHKEIPKERYLSPDERQKVVDDLRLI